MFGRSGGNLLAVFMLLGVVLVGCPEQPRDLGANPEARFEATPATGHVPLPVEFFDQSEPGASDIAQWQWDFGDNTTSMERDPRHTYVTPGTYTVTLTVTTAVGTSTKAVPHCVTVTNPIIVEAIGANGGSVEAFGGSLTVPAGAFGGQVIVGMTADESQMPVDFSEQEQVVSRVFSIQHDQPDLRVERDPAVSSDDNALQIDLPFYALMVPESDRNGEKLYLFAKNGNGARVPVPGRVVGERFIAEITGLPHKADYAVVWRPAAMVATVQAGLPFKASTSYNWPVAKWRVAYSTGMLQTLTALRLGNLGWLAPYDWRDYATPDTDETLDQLRSQIAEIHETADASGLISPALHATQDNEYNVLFYSMRPPVGNYGWLGETFYASSLYGSIVIDPEQLVAICKHQATAEQDGAQEMEFVHAFSEELFRSIFCGYDYDAYMMSVTPEYGVDRQPTNVPFWMGFNEGLATYMSQVAAGQTTARPAGSDTTTILMPRGFSQNEYALLSEPLFAPASVRVPGYATATQDFFFYVANKYAPADDPLTFVADSYDGVLEMMRINTGGFDVVDCESALMQARMAVDNTTRRLFGKGLPEIYWNYACDRAFDNPSDSKLRPSDYFRKAYTFYNDAANGVRFEEQAVVRSTVNGYYEQVFYPTSCPRLANVPPLTTVAVVLTAASGFACDLKVAVNAYDWDVDTYGNRMRAIACLAGAEGVEMTPENSETVLTGFGMSSSKRQAVILLSNTSMEDSYTAQVTVTPRAR